MDISRFRSVLVTETIWMNDRELFEEFVRVERTESRVRILVREIRWDGPAESTSTWAIGQELNATATEAEADGG